MCLAFPGKIIKIEGRKAQIEYPHEKRWALLGDEKLKIGDYVLVQMGIAIQKVTKKEADRSTRAFA